MRYQDLLAKAKEMPVGKHTLFDLSGGKIILHNTGVRHMYMSDRDEYRLLLEINGKSFHPRHSDFFTDFLLKLDAKPDTRLAMNDACELVCNEADPMDVLKKHDFPPYFSSVGQATWTLQTTAYQTAGFSTEVLFCGLQAMILVSALNDPAMHAPEAFRKVFVELSHGIPLHEAAAPLMPAVRPGKRYFDQLERDAKPSL
jgi:hypothetical protein